MDFHIEKESLSIEGAPMGQVKTPPIRETIRTQCLPELKLIQTGDKQFDSPSVPMELAIRKNIALKNFTTYKVGGPAMYFAEAHNGEEIFHLREFAKAKKVPFLIMGLGSNILFEDSGYPGLVVFNRMMRTHFQGPMVTVEGGVPLSQFINTAARLNLGGMEQLIGIPATVGGAIYGNAGVPGFEVSDLLMHALVLPADSHQPVIVQPDYFHFRYRHSHLKEIKDILLGATFRLEPKPRAQIQRDITSILKSRLLKQPAGPSCGSFFKNPGQFPSAGWLIDQAGCKGLKVGGATISEKHANWILNAQDATAGDIISLAQKVYEKVFQKFNILLEPEVQILPNNPFKTN